MKYFDNNKPYSVACIRHQYSKDTGKSPHKKGTMHDPTFEYTKWLELILASKCVDYYLLTEKQKRKKA